MKRTNRMKLAACLMILLIVMAGSLPTAAYSDEEKDEIEEYILTLEQTIENQADYIESLEKENELLEQKSGQLREQLDENRWDRWKGRGEGAVAGVVLTALYVVAN